MQNLKMFIGGNWVDAVSRKTFFTVNPANAMKLSCVPAAGRADIDMAVRAARAANPVWSKKTQSERSKTTHKIAAAIRENGNELAMLESMEHGTPYSDAMNIIMLAAEKFEFAGGAAVSMMGEQIPVQDGNLTYLQRVPVGVVALIIPNNMPTLVMAQKLAPALTAGNTCILKPPSVNSMLGLKFVEIVSKVYMPPGTVNVITGSGEVVGRGLASHPGVDMVAFSGTSANGAKVLSYAGTSGKKCTVAMSANNPAIVMDDADLDACTKSLAWKQFNNSGQNSSGPGRCYVHERVYDAFLDKLIALAKNVVVGDPSDEKTTMGPMASRSRMEAVEQYIRTGVGEGAKVVYSIEKPASLQKGYYVMPTILGDVKQDMTVAREEIFGPVAVIIKFGDDDDIVEMANDSSYGLCAYLWTKDLARGVRMANELNAGSIYINGQGGAMEQSVGTEMKRSGNCREGGSRCYEDYTNLKLISVNFN